jgi:hypothetical protein
MNMRTYKTMSGYISKDSSWEAILIETLLALTQGVEKYICHGVVMTVQEDGTIKKKICLLANRTL